MSRHFQSFKVDWLLDFLVSWFQCFKTPRLRRFKISKFQSVKIAKITKSKSKSSGKLTFQYFEKP